MDFELGQRPAEHRPRRRVPACFRCRARKVKCDNKLPVCTNCEKAGIECDQASNSDKLYTQQLENRVKFLENLVRTHTSHVSPENDVVQVVTQASGVAEENVPSPIRAAQIGKPLAPEVTWMHERQTNTASPAAVSGRTAEAAVGRQDRPSPSVHSHIGPEQLLAHEVGLLSLGNTASEPKYLGPSSGFTLARLTYAAVPQSQGLPSKSHAMPQGKRDGERDESWEASERAPLPSLAEMRRFVGAYVDTFHSAYPFLQDGKIEQLLAMKANRSRDAPSMASLDDAMLFLVASLGARVLEQGRNINLKSSKYLASAMACVVALQLHDSVQGIQVMLLLVLSSFTFPGGLNAWFLSSAIIASCVDLGLQRRNLPLRRYPADIVVETHENMRCGIFWSAYSIDRTLCTILGRPLNLRDEALDVDFPGEIGTGSSSFNAVLSSLCGQGHGHTSSQAVIRDSEHCYDGSAKRRRLDRAMTFDYTTSTFFFRFDRITAEIKLMLYRVAQAPCRFPWPANHLQWQAEAMAACDGLLASARETLSSRVLVSSHYRRLLPCIEIKYHQCVLLLYRPTPAISQPSLDAYRRCYQSAAEVLRIHAEQSRFGGLIDSWLTAYLVFVSGITMIYSLLKLSDLARDVVCGASLVGQHDFDQRIRDCSEVLARLSKTWSVAKDAQGKIDKLAVLTKDTLAGAVRGNSSESRLPLRVDERQDMRSEDTTFNTSPEMDGNFGGMFSSSKFLWDELGDMSNWFDLDWIGDQNHT
ncbi:hypothetical protein BJ170DRAFT_609706 [Xylariales sp. AK1849]|nr:hypothetical protein BJ170DRAFT_609706 [Xylariales sp. AK1849]